MKNVDLSHIYSFSKFSLLIVDILWWIHTKGMHRRICKTCLSLFLHPSMSKCDVWISLVVHTCMLYICLLKDFNCWQLFAHWPQSSFHLFLLSPFCPATINILISTVKISLPNLMRYSSTFDLLLLLLFYWSTLTLNIWTILFSANTLGKKIVLRFEEYLGLPNSLA